MGGEIIRRIIGDYLIAFRRDSLFFYMPNERAGEPLAALCWAEYFNHQD